MNPKHLPIDKAFDKHIRETSFESHSNKVISMAARNVVQFTASQEWTNVPRETYALKPDPMNNVEPITASKHGTNHHYQNPGNMTRLANLPHSTSTESGNVKRKVTPASNRRKKRAVETSAKPVTTSTTRMVQGGPPSAALPHSPVPLVNGMPMYPLQTIPNNGPPVPPLMMGTTPCGPPPLYPPPGYDPYYPPPQPMQPPPSCPCEMCRVPRTVSGTNMAGSNRVPHHSVAQRKNNAKKKARTKTRKVSSSKKRIRNASTLTKAAGSKKGVPTDDALAAELSRGVTVRPSGKWVGNAAAHMCTCNHW